jgi:hypothetical protein
LSEPADFSSRHYPPARAASDIDDDLAGGIARAPDQHRVLIAFFASF